MLKTGRSGGPWLLWESSATLNASRVSTATYAVEAGREWSLGRIRKPGRLGLKEEKVSLKQRPPRSHRMRAPNPPAPTCRAAHDIVRCICAKEYI